MTCWIARWLAEQGIAVGVCKPAVTGAEEGENTGQPVWPDLECLKAACSLDVPEEWIGPYRWRAPLAPPVAARLDRQRGDDRNDFPQLDNFLQPLDRWAGSCDLLLVEGVGGLLCPLTIEATIADLAQAWGRPVVVVASTALGTLNHTLLTVEVAQNRKLDLCGVVMSHCSCPGNDTAESTNTDELRSRLNVPVWGPIPYQTDWEPVPEPIRTVDWLRMAHATRK